MNVMRVRFCDSGSLVKHKRVYTGDKPYECDIYIYIYNFFFFFDLGALVNHQRVHTGEKKSDVSPKSFSRPYCLITHQRLHTREKLFKCDVCEKCLSQSGHYYRHQKVHKRAFSILVESELSSHNPFLGKPRKFVVDDKNLLEDSDCKCKFPSFLFLNRGIFLLFESQNL